MKLSSKLGYPWDGEYLPLRLSLNKQFQTNFHTPSSLEYLVIEDGHTSVLYLVQTLAVFFSAWLHWRNFNGTNLFEIQIFYSKYYSLSVFNIKSWPFLTNLSKLEKCFVSLPSFLLFIVAIICLPWGAVWRRRLCSQLMEHNKNLTFYLNLWWQN